MTRRMSLVLLLFVALSAPAVAELAPEEAAFFEAKIRPLLVERCYACHSGAKTSGGLALDTRTGWQTGGDSGAAIVPGQPEESLLIKAIRYNEAELAMPPEEKGGKLQESEIALLTDWVQRGAPDPREVAATLGGMSAEAAMNWWAFQPLPISETAATAESIDAFINDRMATQALTANGAADLRTLIRRATYDLTGLPPTADEVEKYSSDPPDIAYAKLIDRLLESPQYGVQWGRHWLDVVRYADTAGENTDRPLPQAWRYRNWVIDAFNRDLPYDEFVRLQLAGDILNAEQSEHARSAGIIATGYLAIARRFGHDIDKDIHLMHEDVIDNLGKNFLGLTIGCARCHDHKYDPITAQDYYALYGVFNSTRFAFPGCEPQGQPRDLVPLLSAAQVESLMRPWQERSAAIETEKQRRLELANAAKSLILNAAATSTQLLASAPVGEGESVEFVAAAGTSLAGILVRQGELLQLTVLPNASHGADSTLVEWTLQENGGAQREWRLSDLISRLDQSNPGVGHDGAAWCLLESTANGPVFLTEKHTSLNGQSALKSWSLGDTPSVFANSSDQAVMVWTTLPAKSLFVHPGPNRPVSIAWVCPIDGEISITGRVADVHPGGGDGVAFQLEHFAAPEIGPALLGMGNMLNAALPEAGSAPVIPQAYAVVEGTIKNAPLQLRGDPEKPGAEVPRRWLTVLGGEVVPTDAGSGRKQLGDWVTEQPLAARVMANRVWQWHFGQGLVRSPNDFGTRGDAPTHPELLDRLAAEFVASGYSVKSLHRLMMNTAAYQRSSVRTEAAVQADPENRLLARFTRRRLTAEEIRDTLLVVSGQLDSTPAEGHPFPPEATWTFTQHGPFNAVYPTNKRSAYLMVQRQRRHPFLALFDGADPNASTPVRQTTTAPTQALYFMNDPFFVEQAAHVSQKLLSVPDDGARIASLYRVVLQRDPTVIEAQTAHQFIANYPAEPAARWSALARVLLAGNEFIYLD